MDGRGLNRRRVGRVAAAVALVLVLAGAGLLVGRWVSTSGDATAPAPPITTLSSPSADPGPSPSAAPPAGADIDGPLDILLVGIDTRVTVPGWEPHADAILLLHVPAGLDEGYLYSLPRDLLVTVPAFGKAGFGGGRMKITEAMSRGSRVPGSNRADPRQGLELLRSAVSAYTGITSFDAAAVLTFTGFSRLTDALGGVTMTIDQKVVSQHIRPDGKHRAPRAGGGGYVGPQMTYLPGTRKLVGWQAVDYARQRYTAGGDYTRQRHQRQLVKALLTGAADADLATDPDRLQDVLRALGGTLVFDGGGRTPIEYAYALRDLRPSTLTLVGLPGASVGSGGSYRGEQLQADGRDFLAAVAGDRIEAFLATRPDLVHGG